MNRWSRFGLIGVGLAALAGIGVISPSPVQSACQHGASIFKTCESPKRQCSTDGFCADQSECTNDTCDLSESNVTNCTISIANADTCGDTTRVTGGFDIQDFGGDNVRVPAVGNLPISAVSDNAVCCAGPSLPCFVGPAGSTLMLTAGQTGCGALSLPGAPLAGSVSFLQNTYVVQETDPNPLQDQGNVNGSDLCNAGLSGCSMIPFALQFSAGTELDSGCLHTNKPDSTPCTDSDDNACTKAGCEQGQCVQAHMTTVCQPDSNECTNDLACDPTTGACNHPPVPDSTPCTDSDGNACTKAGCEVGQCVQTHMTTVCQPDSNECTQDPACNPATGQCTHPPVPDSTPCTDSDGNLCTTAGCESGQCVQTHQTTVCQPDSNQCTLDPACNPQTGQCTHPPAPDSTPCGPDTDGNACTIPGCDAGVCNQSHLQNGCPPMPDHFACYEILPTKFTPVTVSLVDQLERPRASPSTGRTSSARPPTRTTRTRRRRVTPITSPRTYCAANPSRSSTRRSQTSSARSSSTS